MGQSTCGHKPEADIILTLAAEKLLAANAIDPKAGLYNLACVAALRGSARDAADWLRKTAAAGALPDAAHIKADTDFDRVRKAKVFQKALADLGLA